MRWLNVEDLCPEDRQLLKAACDISATAYPRESDFPVGAALRVKDPGGTGHTVTGNNFETIVYTSLCAEKHALARAYADHSVAEGEGKEVIRPHIEAVAVWGATAGRATLPCGDCRQTLAAANPDMRVIAGAGADKKGRRDSRVSVSTLRELLPWAFELNSTEVPEPLPLVEPQKLEDHIVHLPVPSDFEDASERVRLLKDIRGMILVGSPARAQAIAKWAKEKRGAQTGCYCDLRSEPEKVSREFALYTARVPGQPGIAIVSHGIGLSGVEIVLSEVPALLHLAADGKSEPLRGVIRSGTRGTIAPVPLGCVALSTSSLDDHLDRVFPDPGLTEAIRSAARAAKMEQVSEGDIDARNFENKEASTLLIEGPGISTTFFWSGQGRPLWRHPQQPGRRMDPADAAARYRLLESWREAGVRWIEMEDYTVHRLCAELGYPSASLGAVIASRRRPDGCYQVDYDHDACQRSEMIPARLAFDALMATLKRGG